VPRQKARRPATEAVSRPPTTSLTGQARGRKLPQEDHVFQGYAVYGEEPFRCIGFLLNRGRDGYAAYDADDHALGSYSSMKDAADAVTAAASARAVGPR
jgi:hypothetical protein